MWCIICMYEHDDEVHSCMYIEPCWKYHCHVGSWGRERSQLKISSSHTSVSFSLSAGHFLFSLYPLSTQKSHHLLCKIYHLHSHRTRKHRSQTRIFTKRFSSTLQIYQVLSLLFLFFTNFLLFFTFVLGI